MSHNEEPTRLIADTLKTPGGATDFSIAGTPGAPVVFSYSPPVDYDVYLLQLQFIFETSNALAFGNKFIDTTIATLTNGLVLEAKTQDLAFVWQNMKRTRDLIEICEDFDIVTGTPNFMRALIRLPHEILLVKDGAYASPDYIRLTVRDNLGPITFAEAHFIGGKL